MEFSSRFNKNCLICIFLLIMLNVEDEKAAVFALASSTSNSKFDQNTLADECGVTFDVDLNERTPFGRQMLKYFQMEPGYVNLNHGSYGAAPKVITECAGYWKRRAEMNPDRWIRYELGPRMKLAAEKMAEYLGVKDPKDVAFIPNASTGINGIVRSLKLNSSDVVVFFSEAYGAVKLTIQYATEFRDAQRVEIPVTYPFQDADVLNALETVLRNRTGRVKLISISHVSSVPAALFPVKEVTRLGRRYQALVLIDGAHALGQLQLNLSELDPDFYVTNGHKWFYTPRGSAILYVKKEHQHLIHPSVISWEYNHGFQMEFHMQGTLDYSNYLAFPAALEFRRRLGDERIMRYNRELADYAGRKLAQVWGTEALLPAYDSRHLSMVNVRLPVNDSIVVHTIVERLLLSHRTFLATFLVNGHWYARLSAQIYNERRDYDELADSFLEIKKLLEYPVTNAYPYCIKKTND